VDRLTDGPQDAPRLRPGEGDEPLRSVVLDRLGRQQASGARLASAVRSRNLWIAAGCWLLAVLVFAVRRGSAAGSVGILLLGGFAVVVWLVSRTSMKAVNAVYPKDKRVTLETSTAGLWLRTVDGSWHAPWTDFRSAERSRHHLLLHRRGQGGAVVLVPPLLGPEVFDDLDAAGIPVTGTDDD
jgi:hypothetical protein